MTGQEALRVLQHALKIRVDTGQITVYVRNGFLESWDMKIHEKYRGTEAEEVLKLATK